MLAQETVLEKLREWMEELFEIAPEDVQLESNLASDLDVDSIDAIDLVVKINEEKKFFARPGTLKNNVCVKITDRYDETTDSLKGYI